MSNLIHGLFAILNMIRCYSAGYTTANNKSMIIQKDDNVYRIDITKVGKGEVDDYMHLLREGDK